MELPPVCSIDRSEGAQRIGEEPLVESGPARVACVVPVPEGKLVRRREELVDLVSEPT